MRKLWRYKELCEYLQCSREHARKLVKGDRIPYKRIGDRHLVRFDPEAIQEWVRDGENGKPLAVARAMQEH